jgi:hypothetical protein
LYNIEKKLEGNLMKTLKIALFASFLSAVAFAKPAFFGGITYKFGSGLENAGITTKVISDNKDKKVVIGAGATYYPWAKSNKQFGLDVSAGYNLKNTTVMAGWDFLQNQPSVSLGFNVSSKDSEDNNDEIADAKTNCNKNK